MSYGKIELNLLFALESSKLDESDFILLAVKLMEKKLSKTPGFPDFFEHIKRQYLVQDYKGAITNILDLCKKNKTLLGEHAVQRLVDAATQLKNNPGDNVSRRFYETLYAKHLEAISRQNTDFSMFNELNKVFDAVKPEYAVNDLVEIKNFDDARKLLLSFLILNDNVELALKEKSAIYKTKDRSRVELGDTLTANPGIIKPNSPNFANNLIPTKKIPKIAMDEAKRDGYSKMNPQIPFVASLSGTTFSLIVLLEHYIEKHKADKNLEEKVNKIIELWVAAYLIDGYHSYGEVIDIFKDSYIQSIFSKANIKLNYAVIHDTTAEFHQAQDYALGIASRSMMHQELVQKVRDKEEQKQTISDFESALERLKQDPDSNSKYPERLIQLDKLYQNWLRDHDDAFKSQCNQIFQEIKTEEMEAEDAKNKFSFGSMLRSIMNFFQTIGVYLGIIEIEPNVTTSSIIDELKDTLEQIKEIKPAAKKTIEKSAQHTPACITSNAPTERASLGDENPSMEKELWGSKSAP